MRIRSLLSILLVIGLAFAWISEAMYAVPISTVKPKSLAINSGFEELTATNLVVGWVFESWQKNPSASFGKTDSTVVHSGKRSLVVTNVTGDDSRFIQYISVKPETWYHFGVWVKTQNVGESVIGANISVMGVQQVSREIRGTHDWTWLEVYGKTGSNQHDLTLALRLGFYGNTTTGTAWFDDLLVEEVPNSPVGASVISLYPEPSQQSGSQPSGLAGLSTMGLTVWALAICLLFGAIAWFFQQRSFRLGGFFGEKWSWRVVGLLAAALVIKVFLAGATTGYPADIATFTAWSVDVFRLGPAGFYHTGYFADYPPAYIYILWVIGAIFSLFRMDPNSAIFLVLLKLPAILADIVAVWVLYRMARSKDRATGNSWFWLAPILWLLSPLATFNSSIWGQVDSIFSLVLLLAFWKLETRKLILAGGLFALAVLFKPQALLAAPLALLWLVRELVQKRPIPVRAVLRPVAAFLVASVVLIVPFSIHQNPLWILSLYGNTLGSYDYATLNAANIWFLFGQNWVANSVPLLGIPLSGWGWGLSLSGMAFVLVCLWKNRSTGGWLLGAFAVYVVFFAVATKMHERYLFPAVLLGFGAFQFLRDKRVLWAALAASLICFIDLLVTLHVMVAEGTSMVPFGNFLMLSSSVATIVLLLWTLYLCLDILLRGNVVELSVVAQRQQALPLPEKLERTEMPNLPGAQGRRTTFLAVLGLTLVYSVVALWGLGSNLAPQHFWEPKNIGESATFDLGAGYQIGGVQYHNGLGSGEYSLEYSLDGSKWEIGNPISNDNQFAEMRWRTVSDVHAARYLRISLTKGRQQLNELALIAANGDTIPSPTLIKSDEDPSIAGNPASLFDEPNTRVTVSDYTNGMYFDEVYFARSAWEILQGRNATENTHPPLGKIIIAGSVAVLGMNPLAWRLPGTISGILMIPLLYLLAVRLFRNRIWAFLAAWLLAVDFMHFTQTRISTVDTFVMLFVLSAYYWMIRWRQDAIMLAEGQGPKLNPLWSLILSGISIALAIATKWTGIYAAAGLAVLFFIGFFQMGRTWLRLNSRKTILTCLIAFIVIPLIIYVCAYIPLMSVTGSGLAGIVENQTSMWNYHSGMKDSHPYSSQWYTWPLMLKPMWYYSGGANVAPNLASTIIAFGNPLIWWGGSLAFLFVLIGQLVRRKISPLVTGGPTYNRQIGLFIIVSGLAQYLPWAIIPRKLVFIYHFFLTMPFILLALVFVIREISERGKNQVWAKHLWWVVGAVATIAFIAYFPVLGGTPFPRSWAEGLKALGIPIYF